MNIMNLSKSTNHRRSNLTSTLIGVLLLGSSATAAANTSPSSPNRLGVEVNSYGYVVVTWNSATDTDGQVVGYTLIKNNVEIELGNITYFRDNETSPGNTYTYSVVAIDNHGGRSVASSTAEVSVTANGSSVSVTSTSTSGSSSSSSSSSSTGNGSHGTCVDIDGDGYGWNGKSSCAIFNFPDHTGLLSECIDEDKDGWGWNGYETCTLHYETDEHTLCTDTDGDGWGWNGSESCKMY